MQFLPNMLNCFLTRPKPLEHLLILLSNPLQTATRRSSKWHLQELAPRKRLSDRNKKIFSRVLQSRVSPSLLSVSPIRKKGGKILHEAIKESHLLPSSFSHHLKLSFIVCLLPPVVVVAVVVQPSGLGFSPI